MNNKVKIPSDYMKPPLTTKGLNKLWTENEIKVVLTQAGNKRSPEEIAKKLNRSVSDIRSRLKSIAANMYINDKIPYEQIHEQTGVEKNTLILTPSKVRHEITDTEKVVLDISIYDFPEDEKDIPDKQVNVDIKDNSNEMIITVSVESPFSVKSICEHISTPIFSTCSRFVKKISSIQYETILANTISQTPH